MSDVIRAAEVPGHLLQKLFDANTRRAKLPGKVLGKNFFFAPREPWVPLPWLSPGFPWPSLGAPVLQKRKRNNGTAGIQAKARIQAVLANLQRNPYRN